MNGIWNFVSGLVLGIGVPIALHLFREVKPKLSYRITQDRPLLAEGTGNIEDIRVMSHDLEVDEPWVWGVAIRNNGKVPVRPSDFASPISFTPDKPNVILQAGTLGDAEFHFSSDDEGIIQSFGLAPQLINPGEALELVALTDGKVEFGQPNARIAGIKRIRPVVEPRAVSHHLLFTFEAMVGLLIAILIAYVALSIIRLVSEDLVLGG